MTAIAAAYQFAADVCYDDKPAPQTVKLACQRFIDDVSESQSGGRWELELERVEKVCKFLGRMPHVKGRWAAKSETFALADWQVFATVNLYGWVDRDTGLRRFREGYIQVPRKNGKSFWFAGLGNYHFAADGDYGAEVYSGATSEKQAWEVFRPARLQWVKSEALAKEYDVEVNAKNLAIISSGNRFEPIIGNPGDGSSPSCAIVDEFDAHDSWAMLDTMQTGMGDREETLLLVITTAGTSIGGPCHDKYNECKKILEGTVKDDRVFALIYEPDEGDRWDCMETVEKVNPNFGISVNPEYLQTQLEQARRSGPKQNAFRTKHLNQWVGARTSWMNMLAWQAARGKGREAFKGKPCYAAVDLAQKIDVCTVSTTFRDGDKFHTFVDAFVPRGAMGRGDKRTPVEQYLKFEGLDNFHLTEGDATDYGAIEGFILELSQQYQVRGLGYDQWQAEYLAQRLTGEGVSCMQYQQNVKNMSAPMKEIEARVLEKKFRHDGCPLLTWFVGNVMSRRDEKENEYPAKENKDSPNKIDGAVSMIMSMGLWMAEKDYGSVYDHRGMRAV